MTAKHSPATPLPWPGLVTEPVFIGKDADFIVHAANAYPKLIAALQSMIESHSDITDGNLHSGAPARVAVKRDARALLRSLGEAE